MKLIQIHPDDNVAVALTEIAVGEAPELASASFSEAAEAIARGHKIALREIKAGTPVIKYGCEIGIATETIAPGHWVHVHNVRTNLREDAAYEYHHTETVLPRTAEQTFEGYLRPDGRAAVRNELWIIPVVGCVNSVAQNLVRENAHLVSGSIDGLYTFPHPYGCSQMGDDHEQTKRLLAALADHPNAGGVLVLGLGCENITPEQFREALGDYDSRRIRFLICQDVEDELAEGAALLRELADYAKTFRRQTLPASKLVIGMKCGGSDGLSGITANPAVGRFSDKLISLGGSTVLTEVPEMFGAESILFNRCVSGEVFQKAVHMVEDFKAYFVRHGQVVYENPSPGNKAGGITTLEDKSCGCVQKGGSAQIVDVLDYAMPVTKPGLTLLSGPGNDLVSATALAASGAHIILFTTGRGTPFGAPVPTLKLASNTALFEKKKNWIDFNAGTIAEGESPDAAADRLLADVLAVAGGRLTRSEEGNMREIAIFKDGVTL